MAEAKPPYLETHRFGPSEQGTKLLHNKIEVFEQLNKKYPGIKGIAFFGGWVKGQEKPSSDIDMVVFYNGNELHDPNKTYIPALVEAEQSFIKVAEANERTLELASVDISEEATDRDLERYEKTSDPRAKFNLVTRFFLGTGEGLYENRKYLLDKLEAQGETGQKTFEGLMQELFKLDRRTTIDSAIIEREGFREIGDPAPVKQDIAYKGKYPQTIDEAKRHFITDRKLWHPVDKP
jgi:predicted nucleotidyltransferase